MSTALTNQVVIDYSYNFNFLEVCLGKKDVAELPIPPSTPLDEVGHSNRIPKRRKVSYIFLCDYTSALSLGTKVLISEKPWYKTPYLKNYR